MGNFNREIAQLFRATSNPDLPVRRFFRRQTDLSVSILSLNWFPYSYKFEEKIISSILFAQAVRSSSARYWSFSAVSASRISRRSVSVPGMIRSFPAAMHFAAEEPPSAFVVVQSVMMMPAKPHSFLAAVVQRSQLLAVWTPFKVCARRVRPG